MHKLLKAEDLKVWYPTRKNLNEMVGRSPARHVKAVDGVSFSISKGETLGIIGESGCGKSTLGRAILGLEKKTGGLVYSGTENQDDFKRPDWQRFRQSAQMIFQDPMMSLNPKMTIGAILAEVLKVHAICAPGEREGRISDLLQAVGLSPEVAKRKPRTLSGGQCQRIGIARALAVNPDLIVADESVSALDVSVQAQILNLFVELQRSRNLAMIFISHDLEVIRHVCRNVLVMYLGKVVESGPVEEVFNQPRHPYTRALVSSSPKMDGPTLREMELLAGEPPSPLNRPLGCAFHPRCEHVMSSCKIGKSPKIVREDQIEVSCHLYGT